MTLKNKIIESLTGKKLTVKEITKIINNNNEIKINENQVRVNINRLKKDDLIEKCGIDSRYKIYKLKNEKNNKSNNELTDKLVLLMIKAGINSEKYGVNITEPEIQQNIKRLMERGIIG